MGYLLGCDILTEAYYGKSKELLECEKALDVIVDFIKGKRKSMPGGKSIDNSNELKLIRKNICKVFDLNGYFLYFKDTIPAKEFISGAIPRIAAFENNACTPVSIIKYSKTGTKILKKTKIFTITTVVDKNLIYNYDLNAAETMAILLHEIGHNFDRSLFSLLHTVLPDTYDLIHADEKALAQHITDLLKVSIMAEPLMLLMGKATAVVTSLFEKIPGFNKVYERVMALYNGVMGIYYKYNGLKSIPLYLTHPEFLIYRYANPRAFFGYAGEKYADSFASTYGYSVELSSAMRKIQKGGQLDRAIAKVPVANVVYDLGRTANSLVFLMADPHPKEAIRIYSQLKKMERELNDPSVPKELKKEIKEQIDELKKITEDIIDIKSDENKNIVFTTLYNSLLIKTFNGNIIDPREALECIWRHEA